MEAREIGGISEGLPLKVPFLGLHAFLCKVDNNRDEGGKTRQADALRISPRRERIPAERSQREIVPDSAKLQMGERQTGWSPVTGTQYGRLSEIS